MASSLFLEQLRSSPLVGILRDIQPRHLRPLFRACEDAGLGFLEITMNTEEAADMIRALVAIRDAGMSKMKIGAGTVRTAREAVEAVNAGAEFLVSPVLSLDVMGEALRLQVPVIPGALTPTEIENAWKAGASAVKVFPVRTMGGPRYIHDLRGPLRDIPLLACGGVAADNAEEYLAAGADALAFGAGVFQPQWLESGAFDKIGASISAFRNAVGMRHPGV